MRPTGELVPRGAEASSRCLASFIKRVRFEIDVRVRAAFLGADPLAPGDESGGKLIDDPRLRVGEAAVIPAWVPHRVRASDAGPATQIDVFCPPREGLLRLLEQVR